MDIILEAVVLPVAFARTVAYWLHRDLCSEDWEDLADHDPVCAEFYRRMGHKQFVSYEGN